jgi:hypothetical protein
MEKEWKIIIILFVLIAIIAAIFVLLIKFEIIKPKSPPDPNCVSNNICYFKSRNILCTSNYDCDSKQLSSLHASCDLSTSKCEEFTDRRIITREECLEKGGKWDSDISC